jgi:hypothetical protein
VVAAYAGYLTRLPDWKSSVIIRGTGHFKNELKIENTLDPSPYLGLKGSVDDDWSRPITCSEG